MYDNDIYIYETPTLMKPEPRLRWHPVIQHLGPSVVGTTSIVPHNGCFTSTTLSGLKRRYMNSFMNMIEYGMTRDAKNAACHTGL